MVKIMIRETYLFCVLVNLIEQTGQLGPMFNFLGFDMKISLLLATKSESRRNMSNLKTSICN